VGAAGIERAPRSSGRLRPVGVLDQRVDGPLPGVRRRQLVADVVELDEPGVGERSAVSEGEHRIDGAM
jgi:hypothetical protein